MIPVVCCLFAFVCFLVGCGFCFDFWLVPCLILTLCIAARPVRLVTKEQLGMKKKPVSSLAGIYWKIMTLTKQQERDPWVRPRHRSKLAAYCALKGFGRGGGAILSSNSSLVKSR